MSAEALVRTHGNYVIATGTMKGRRLMDLNEAELQLLAASRKQGESANRCRDFARAYLSLSALNRQPAVPAGTPSSIPLQDNKSTTSNGGNGVGGTNSVPESCQLVQFQGNPRGRAVSIRGRRSASPENTSNRTKKWSILDVIMFVWPSSLGLTAKVISGVIISCCLMIVYPPLAAFPGRLLGMSARSLIARVQECIQYFWSALDKELQQLSTDLWLWVTRFFAIDGDPSNPFPVGKAVGLVLSSMAIWKFVTTPFI